MRASAYPVQAVDAVAVESRKAKVVSLKAPPILNERWLQAILADDPSLLGLGDGLILRDAERRQARAGPQSTSTSGGAPVRSMGARRLTRGGRFETPIP